MLVVDVWCIANCGLYAEIGYPRVLQLRSDIVDFHQFHQSAAKFCDFHSTIFELKARLTLAYRFDQLSDHHFSSFISFLLWEDF